MVLAPACDSFILFVSRNGFTQTSTEFEDLIASLKISTDRQETAENLPPAPSQTPAGQSDGPLSPQSFAMVSVPSRNASEAVHPSIAFRRSVLAEGHHGVEGDAED